MWLPGEKKKRNVFYQKGFAKNGALAKLHVSRRERPYEE